MRQLDAGLWVFDRALRIAGLNVGTRMTAIRLDDGGLFLHSPVALDAPTRDELETLGPVRHVVAPSKVHHLYAGEYGGAYPEARLYAAPGLPEKRSDVAFDEVLGDEPPAGWSGQIEQRLFAGTPYLNEVVFFHPATRTLLLTDLAFNVTEPEGFLTALWQRAAGTHRKFGTGRPIRWLTRDRQAARAARDAILAWDFDRVIVTHGVVVQERGHRLVRAALEWLD